jgi:nicotinamidase-related amidase
MTTTLTLDRKHTAFLIMDYQNTIVSGVVEKYPDLLDKTAAVLAAARAADMPIIYIVVSFREGYPQARSSKISNKYSHSSV